MAKRLYTYSAATNSGLARDNNEDTYLSEPDHGLWLVADGMGGHEAGEVASAIVRDSFRERAGAIGSNQLEARIHAAHRAILTAVDAGEGAPGMGSTLVLLTSTRTDYRVFWVGDSRAYLWSRGEDGGQLERLTHDHSHVQKLVDSGAIDSDEAQHHPQKNIITQCLGFALQPIDVDQVAGEWRENQWILLCSDGLTDELDDREMAEILCASRSPKAAVDKLMGAALAKGGRDNITLQIVQSPRYRRSLASSLWQWLPPITGQRYLDLGLSALALLCLGLALYWIGS
ncbi:PP2C family protein-serine/threonine phosphatase [Marinimicrobium alkaliphilum]|uniref:PP2C family protein-serine/threonine phosphatase n=1 Tax=Marinimicrobium alkaliphilum TaxID=2202654 RepID=UPI000DB9BA82|nr:protein phosphatase 2C domain-containing protein [Marinimicrobium alkaliphilum]